MKQPTTDYKKSSFGPAFLFLDPKRRRALAAYYAIFRHMDDIADEPEIVDKQAQLDFWKQEIARVFSGNAETDLGKELQQQVQEFAIPETCFLQLIEGMQADVQTRAYGTLQDLQWYLWRVAGVVGLAILHIIGIKGPKADELARELGFAVQLTNIVRDIQEDARLNRVYIPVQLLQRYGVTPVDILQDLQSVQLTQVLRVLAQMAQEHYTRAEQIMNTLPSRKMLPCRIMGFVYQKNLAKIEKKGFMFQKPVKLSKLEKLTACVYALYKTMVTH